MNYQGVKVFYNVNCLYPVATLYIQVALYKAAFFGPYQENTGYNTNHLESYVAAGAGIYCSNFTQATTFWGTAYAYSIDGGVTYSAEGTGPSATLDCGTPG